MTRRRSGEKGKKQLVIIGVLAAVVLAVFIPQLLIVDEPALAEEKEAAEPELPDETLVEPEEVLDALAVGGGADSAQSLLDVGAESSSPALRESGGLFGVIAEDASLGAVSTSSAPTGLEGILVFGASRSALLDGRIYRRGDPFESGWIEAIDHDSVTVRDGSAHRVIEFSVLTARPVVDGGEAELEGTEGAE